MKTIIVHLIVGARPNFMKMAPLYKALKRRGDSYTPLLIHTGQHYDEKMSKLFFEDLCMPEPDAYLHVGSGTHGQQTARIIERYEEYILSWKKPDLVIVAGDVNSTIACALVAKKLHIPVAHLEAGLRSFDERMPEEINRVLTDRISDLLLTPSEDGDANLLKEGVSAEKIHLVGNIMIDSLVEHRKKAEQSTVMSELGICDNEPYVLVTLHRPSNVDEADGLEMHLSAFSEIGKQIRIVFPMHSLAAAWHGNDTTWRMVMDLNIIAKYGKSDGTISDRPQRDILYICDGIIGGQGDGPLHPDPLPLGVVMVSDNPALMDIALARLMGFDENKFPLLRAANEAFNCNEPTIILNGVPSSLEDLSTISVKTCPPPGWVDYLCLKDND